MTGENLELEMLREFYKSWVAMHKTPRDKLHRRKMEAQAQLLVDNAHTLRRFYESQQPETPPLRLVEEPANG
jgi:hypothetical protein